MELGTVDSIVILDWLLSVASVYSSCTCIAGLAL